MKLYIETPRNGRQGIYVPLKEGSEVYELHGVYEQSEEKCALPSGYYELVKQKSV